MLADQLSTTTGRSGDASGAQSTAIRADGTLAGAFPVLGNTTLNELIIGIIPRSALAWEEFPIDGLQLFAQQPQKLAALPPSTLAPARTSELRRDA